MENIMLRLSDTGGGGDKPVAKSEVARGKARTGDDDTADIRDIINSFIGKGGIGMKDDTSRADYARLQTLLGPEKAQKLMESVFIHNQRSATEPLEKRIQTFYDVGSNNQEVDAIIKKTKQLGYGPLVGGLRESSKATLQQLTGRMPASTIAAVDNRDLQNKLMLRLK